MPQKKVRIVNSTQDVAFLRVYIQHFDAGIQVMADVPRGQFVQNNHMTQGHRGVIVYEDFNQEIIAVGQFELASQNIRVIVNGDAANGYSISYAVDSSI